MLVLLLLLLLLLRLLLPFLELLASVAAFAAAAVAVSAAVPVVDIAELAAVAVADVAAAGAAYAVVAIIVYDNLPVAIAFPPTIQKRIAISISHLPFFYSPDDDPDRYEVPISISGSGSAPSTTLYDVDIVQDDQTNTASIQVGYRARTFPNGFFFFYVEKRVRDCNFFFFSQL